MESSVSSLFQLHTTALPEDVFGEKSLETPVQEAGTLGVQYSQDGIYSEEIPYPGEY